MADRKRRDWVDREFITALQGPVKAGDSELRWMLTAFVAVDLAAAVLAAPRRGIWSAAVVIGAWVAITVLFGLVALRIRRYSRAGFAWFIVASAAFLGMTPIALFVPYWLGLSSSSTTWIVEEVIAAVPMFAVIAVLSRKLRSAEP